MTARSGFAERERAQVRAAGCGLPHLARATGFEHGRSGEVHAGHHRGRSTFLRETADDSGGAAEAEAKAAHLWSADRAQEAGGSERLYPTFGERTVAIDGGGIRGNDLCTDFFECWSKTRGVCGHAYLGKDTEAAFATLRWQPELRLDAVEP